MAVDPKANNSPLEDLWMIMKSRDIPVQVAHGWHGYMLMTSSAPMMRLRDSATMVSNHLTVEVRSMPLVTEIKKKKKKKWWILSCVQSSKDEYELNDENYEDAVTVIDYVNKDPTTEAKNPISPSVLPHPTVLSLENADVVTDDEKLMKLVDSQSFNGAFKMEPNLAQLLDTTFDIIKEGKARRI